MSPASHSLACRQRPDVIGSPYAIVEYHCNPQLGTDEELRAFRKRLNAMGLYLMLDFVPNVWQPHDFPLVVAITAESSPAALPSSTRPLTASGHARTPTSMCERRRMRRSPTTVMRTTRSRVLPTAAAAGVLGRTPSSSTTGSTRTDDIPSWHLRAVARAQDELLIASFLFTPALSSPS